MNTRVIYRDLNEDACGYYDHARDEIHIDRRMPRVDQVCTLEHEMTHRMLGHKPIRSYPAHIGREITVDRVTARRLIPFAQLLASYTAIGKPGGAAAFLRVDQGTLYARFLDLTSEEQLILEVCGRYCIGIGAALGECASSCGFGIDRSRAAARAVAAPAA